MCCILFLLHSKVLESLELCLQASVQKMASRVTKALEGTLACVTHSSGAAQPYVATPSTSWAAHEQVAWWRCCPHSVSPSRLPLQCVEVSQESPAWTSFLAHADSLVCQGLKDMVLTAIGTLISRAQSYEQVGGATSWWAGLQATG